MTLTYAERASLHNNTAAKKLLGIIERKESNLCVSVDVTTKNVLLEIVDAVGPSVCLVKTHADIIEDFDQDLINRLSGLAEKHNFMIFEDRKFADIGNTVKLQYAKGVHKIATWAHIINAHPVPGPGIIHGLKTVGLPRAQGLLLLAEMSSKGNLATGKYTQEAIEMARANRDFVIGFIAMSRQTLNAHIPNKLEDFLILTPGVGLDTKSDGLGQQYRTPREVIFDHGCDVIIVGRGIYGQGDYVDVASARSQAERYRQEGWKAYLERVTKSSS